MSFEEDCKRDTARPNGVGYSVIAKQIEQMNKYTVAFNPPEATKHEHKEGIPTCIIVDIDGTLAHNTLRCLTACTNRSNLALPTLEAGFFFVFFQCFSVSVVGYRL